MTTPAIPLSNIRIVPIQPLGSPATTGSRVGAQPPTTSGTTTAGPAIQLRSSRISAPSTPSRGLHAITKHLSSARINSLAAVVALGVGAYYYYGQYIISWKSWEVGVWKDCHDRPDIVNTTVCQSYFNLSYDDISKRSEIPLIEWGISPTTDQHELLPLSLLTSLVMVPCLFLLAFFIAIGHLIFQGLIFVCDMISGHKFPQRADYALFLLVAVVTSSVLPQSPAVFIVNLSICTGVLIVCRATPTAALAACLRASRDPRRSDKWKYYGLSALICYPVYHFVVEYVFAIRYVSHTRLQSAMSEYSSFAVGSFTIWMASVSLVVFSVSLFLAQRDFLQLLRQPTIDPEAQREQVPPWFLKRRESTSKQLIGQRVPYSDDITI